ncbi:MAG: hypothetical protein KJO07_15775, partial [Deltaproteobacteria bacterium]|nr:hypothetical protein [Deltaproteobacteria bacterium]
MTQLLLPAFVDGDLSLNHQSFLEPGATPAKLRGGQLEHEAFNLGELLGLRGHLSLVPLALVWAALGVWWWRRRTARLNVAN